MSGRALIARMAMPVVRRAGRAYIAGPELEDAIAVALRLAGRGFASTICYWDAKDASGDEVVEAYIASARALRKYTLDCYLSVKAPSVEYDLDRCVRLLEACGNNTRVHFDSLGPESADPTFALISNLLPRFPNITCTLPGRWARSVRDADWAIERTVGVRVVKGQWDDADSSGIDPEEGYLRIIERLAGRVPHVAVATHNPKLANMALRLLLEAGTACELELLFGLPVEPAIRGAQNLGVDVRLYIPYGYGWLPYSLSQAGKNPRVLWWMLKDMVCQTSRSGIYAA